MGTVICRGVRGGGVTPNPYCENVKTIVVQGQMTMVMVTRGHFWENHLDLIDKTSD